MNAPSRNRAMMPSVNSNLRRRSGVLNACANALSKVPPNATPGHRWSAYRVSPTPPAARAGWGECCPEQSCPRTRTGAALGCCGLRLRDTAAGGLDLLLRGIRPGVSLDVEPHGHVARAEHLHQVALAHGALLDEVGYLHAATLGEQLGELVEVDHLVLDAERVLEPAQLRQPHVQWHLAALEPSGNLVTGLRALCATPGGLALRALTASDTPLDGLRSRRGTQVVDLENVDLLGLLSHHFTSSTVTRWATARIMPRVTPSSGRSTVWPIFLSPSERSVSRWFCLPPMADLICVTFRPAIMHLPLRWRARPASGRRRAAHVRRPWRVHATARRERRAPAAVRAAPRLPPAARAS